MGAANTHFEETGAEGIPIAVAVCRRVPAWAALSTDPAEVTCCAVPAMAGQAQQ